MQTRARTPAIPVFGAAAALLALAVTAGCGNAPSGEITKRDEEMMRRPVGTTPMPPEAAKAMQQANERANEARKKATGTN